MEEAYHRCGEREGEDEDEGGKEEKAKLEEKLKKSLKKRLKGKGKDEDKKKFKSRGCPDMLNHETGTEEIEPTYLRAFKAKLAKIDAQAAKGTTAKTASNPKKYEEPKETPRVLMFDQLWIWAINPGERHIALHWIEITLH
jgi:hypothetical protein